MKLLVGAVLFGFMFAWGSFILFTGWYLRERDEIITELLEERKQLFEKIEEAHSWKRKKEQ